MAHVRALRGHVLVAISPPPLSDLNPRRRPCRYTTSFPPSQCSVPFAPTFVRIGARSPLLPPPPPTWKRHPGRPPLGTSRRCRAAHDRPRSVAQQHYPLSCQSQCWDATAHGSSQRVARGQGAERGISGHRGCTCAGWAGKTIERQRIDQVVSWDGSTKLLGAAFGPGALAPASSTNGPNSTRSWPG